MINTVKIQGTGFLVNGTMSVPNAQGNRHYRKVQDWLIGKTADWKAVEQQHIAETNTYDNWVAIQSYETNLATYQADLAAYNAWTPGAETEQPIEPTAVVKPQGYYTQIEVDESIVEHDDWVVLQSAFVSEEGSVFSLPEPELKQRPLGITEPTVITLPAPVPNTPDPEFTQAEIDQKVIDDNNAQVAQELADLDKASIRDIREWIAAQPSAPQMLKGREVAAVSKRSEML